MTTYNPFHHLLGLDYFFEDGDMLVRLALLELLKKENIELGPYGTALESGSFFARMMLAIHQSYYGSHVSESFGYDSAGVVLAMSSALRQELRKHVVTPGHYREELTVFNLSLADQERLINVCASLTKEFWDQLEEARNTHFADYYNAELLESYRALLRSPMQAISEVFSIEVVGEQTLQLFQGGLNNYPSTVRNLSSETGPYYSTWEGMNQWGLYIPPHPAAPDDDKPRFCVKYDHPDATTYIVMHNAGPGRIPITGDKAVKIPIRGDELNNNVSILNRDVRTQGWLFSIVRPSPTQEASDA